MLCLDFIRDKWNALADDYNQWPELDADERVTFAIKIVKRECAEICSNLALESDPEDFVLDALYLAQSKIEEA